MGVTKLISELYSPKTKIRAVLTGYSIAMVTSNNLFIKGCVFV